MRAFISKIKKYFISNSKNTLRHPLIFETSLFGSLYVSCVRVEHYCSLLFLLFCITCYVLRCTVTTTHMPYHCPHPFNRASLSLSLSLFSTMVLFILPSRRRARCQRTSSNRSRPNSSRTEKCEKNGSTRRSFRQASSLRTLVELQGWYRWRGCAKLSTFVRRSIPRVASFEVCSCCC